MKKNVLGVIAGVVCAAASVNSMAAVIDISTPGDTATVGGAIFTSQSTGPTGSGVLGSILRIQNSNSEQGYNTNGGTPFDNKGGVSLNNGAVQLSALTTVTVSGTAYVGFLLDWDEPNNGGSPLLTMHEFQVYVSDSGDQTTTTFNGDNRTLPLGTLVYDLEPALVALNDDALLMADNFSGNGKSDYTVLVPAADFVGYDLSKYLTLYMKLGDDTDATTGSFEEVGLISGDTPLPPPGGGPTPEPASIGILALGAGALLVRRKARQ